MRVFNFTLLTRAWLTEQQTDGRTGKASYKIAGLRLKNGNGRADYTVPWEQSLFKIEDRFYASLFHFAHQIDTEKIAQ